MFCGLTISLLLVLTTLTQALPVQVVPRGESFTGSGTFYDVGLGSCGFTNSNDELVVALSSSVMLSGKRCGSKIKIHSDDGSVTATVVDTCPSCQRGDLDLSPAAFDKIGDEARGRIKVTWSFV